MGRWASENSFDVYLQEAMALLVWSQIDASIAPWLELDLQSNQFAWLQPPSVSCLKLWSQVTPKKARRCYRQSKDH
eukprot:699153-Karenia_brevis.AAC.1